MQTIAYKRCPQCHQPAVLDKPFCGRCGRAFRTAFPAPATRPHNPYLWLGSLAALVILGVILLLCQVAPDQAFGPPPGQAAESSSSAEYAATEPALPPQVVDVIGGGSRVRNAVGMGGTVYVSSYTRRDGTRVRGHYRRR